MLARYPTNILGVSLISTYIWPLLEIDLGKASDSSGSEAKMPRWTMGVQFFLITKIQKSPEFGSELDGLQL